VQTATTEEFSIISPRTKNKTISGRTSWVEQTVLLLQGGGALGSDQAGVYQVLAEADLHPDGVAGISIGAVNAALIAGNPSERRVEKLREFWEAVSTPPLGVPPATATGRWQS
jgi:NTE family protein